MMKPLAEYCLPFVSGSLEDLIVMVFVPANFGKLMSE